MNWLEFMRREKRLSSLELEKPDVPYEVWELGRTIAKISEVCWLIRPPLKEVTEKGFLIREVGDSLYCLKVIYKKLSSGSLNILGWIEDLDQEIEKLSDKNTLKSFRPEEVKVRIEEIERLINCQLIASSVHLFHVFSLSLSLRRLKTKLLYGLELEGEGIESHIKHTIDLLEKLRLGDKVLISPNLEVTNQNLKIIKFRLEGWLKFLPELRNYSKEIGCYSEKKTRFIKKIVEGCDLWTELILDIKNPSNYLSFWQRFLNAAIPLLPCYYLMAITVVFIPWKYLLKDTDLLAILTPILIPLLYFCRWLYIKIKDYLVEKRFRFKLSEFKG